VTYSIGELAAAGGVHVETIRFYERRGLLPEPPRTGSGYRRYDDTDRWRLAFIQRAKLLGFRLRDIGALLGDEAPRSVEEVTRVASVRLTEMEQELLDLVARRDRLQALLATCATGPDTECLDLSPAATCTA
jgi:MerR family mercuric resistance operon transcriptional regulator